MGLWERIRERSLSGSGGCGADPIRPHGPQEGLCVSSEGLSGAVT